MALFCSQEAANITRWLYGLPYGRHLRHSLGIDRPKQAIYAPFDWIRDLLLLDYAVEFPFIVAYHPLTLTCHATKLQHPPTDNVVFTQVLLFFGVEWALYQLFVRYCPLFSIEGSTTAFRIATDFTVARTTVLVAISVIQAPSLIGIGSHLGDFHFVTVVVWIFLRRLLDYELTAH